MATSGPPSIAVHLLACMLARSRPAPVATSLWVELVAERRKELENEADESQLQGLFTRVAAQQEISRGQLAAWDASARAWLRTADEVKKFEQKQLKLITENSGLSLSTSGNTYSSVIEAWLMAMKILQKLIIGVPHNISKASVLLGLHSWHIYPDLNVVDPTTNIQFRDPLVQGGGVVTLGLQRADSLGDGVHWSLSLSHLRFYGDPVVLERSIGSIGSDDGRLSISELQLVALGSMVSRWINPASFDPISIANCFVALGECLDSQNLQYACPEDQRFTTDLWWLQMLILAARRLLSSEGLERRHAIDHVGLGKRHGRGFLDDKAQEFCPMFGLVNPLVLFQFVEKPETELGSGTSISALRNLAQQCELYKDDCIPPARFRNVEPCKS